MYISKEGVQKQGEWQNGRKIRWIGEDAGTTDFDKDDYPDN